MADAPISTNDLIMHVLNGLDNDYNAIVSVLVNMGELSWVEVHAQLLAFENRLDQATQLSSLSLQPSVHYAQGNGSRPAVPNSAGRGFWRGGRATFSAGARGRGRRGSSGSGSRPFCHLCERPGHIVSNCFRRFDRTFHPPTYSPRFGESSQAFHASPHTQNFQSQLSSSLHASPQTVNDPAWYMDSGANYHVTPFTEQLEHVDSVGKHTHLLTCTGDVTPIVGVGSGSLSLPHSKLSLRDVLVVPNATKNLLSVHKLTTDNAIDVTFSGGQCVVKDKISGAPLVRGTANQGLYPLHTSMKDEEFDHFPAAAMPLAFSASSVQPCSSPKQLRQEDVQLWHYKLGHPSSRILSQVLHQCNFRFSPLNHVCEACQFGKSKKLPFSQSLSHASSPFELVHTDLWGPSPIQSTLGHRYYIHFVDDYSRYTWLSSETQGRIH